MIINKPTASSLLILCLLLKKEHSTLASSRRLPFVNTKKSHSIDKQLSNQNSSHSISKENNVSKTNDKRKEDREYSHFENHSNRLRRDQHLSHYYGEEAEIKEPSKLIEIPLSLTLQHESGSHPRIPLTTFLDTGAQVTVMTFKAAKRAGLAHLIDMRYSGRACGVAGVSCRVLGRIPANSVSFIMGREGHLIDKSPAITVLEDGIIDGNNLQKVDILLGLDVLQDWQATICLRDRTLTLRNCSRMDTYDAENGAYVVIPFAGCVQKTVLSFESTMASSNSVKKTQSVSTNISSNYDEYLNQYYSTVKRLEADIHGNEEDVEYVYDDEDGLNDDMEDSSTFSATKSLGRGGACDDEDEDDDDDYLDENEDGENFDLSGV